VPPPTVGSVNWGAGEALAGRGEAAPALGDPSGADEGATADAGATSDAGAVPGTAHADAASATAPNRTTGEIPRDGHRGHRPGGSEVRLALTSPRCIGFGLIPPPRYCRWTRQTLSPYGSASA